MTGNQALFQKAMEQGHSAAWDQRWDLAVRFYWQALDEIHDHPMALSSLALALFQLQDYGQSLRFYQRAAMITPSDAVPYEKIGNILERQGRLSEAIQAHLQAAELQVRAQNPEKAIENWIHICSLQPDHTLSRTRLAMAYDRGGYKTEAINEFLALASIMQMNGDRIKAIQIVEYALQIKPDSPEAKLALSQLNSNQLLPKPPRPKGGTGPVLMAKVQQLENPKESSHTLQDPVTEARQRALVHLASLLFDINEGETPNQDIAKRNISDISRGASSGMTDYTRTFLHLRQAIDALTKGAENQAAGEFERAIESGLNEPAADFICGLLILRSDSQKSIRYLNQTSRKGDYSLASHLLIGQIFQLGEDYQAAAREFLEALCMADSETVLPEQVDELRQLYEPVIENQTQHTDKATLKILCENIASQLLRPEWRQALLKARKEQSPATTGQPPLPLVEMLLQTRSFQVVDALSTIRQLAGMNAIRSAVEEAYRAVGYAPTYLPMHTQLGELMYREGRIQDAVEKFNLVAELYRLRGDFVMACQLLRRIIEISPMDIKIRLKLINLLTNQGKIQDALQQYMDLADIYYHMAELELARQTYNSSLHLAKLSKHHKAEIIQILNKIADIDLQRLNLRQAVLVFEQIRTIEPDDGSARLQLIDLLFRLGSDSSALTEVDSYVALLENSSSRSKAVEFLVGLINEHPEKIELHRKLAEIYIRNRQIPLAVQQLESIVDSQVKASNRNEAIRALQTIVALKPDNVEQYRAVIMKLQLRS